MKSPIQLACRAAMLKEAADALPPGRGRDLVLLQLQALEELLRARATFFLQPAASTNFNVDAVAY